MENQPREKPKGIIDGYGADYVLADARRCEGLLRDLCGGYKRETHVLLCALRERVPHELRASSGVAYEVLCARLTARLHDELALTEEASAWAVAAWAAALGVIDEAAFNNLIVARPQASGPQLAPAPPKPQPYRAPGGMPEIRGLRLGMPVADVLNIFPDLYVNPADVVGSQWGLLMVDSYKPVSPSAAGLKTLRLQFLDGQLASVDIEYNGTAKWNSVDEFAAKISEMLGLSGDWSGGSGIRGRRQFNTPQYRLEITLDFLKQRLLLQDVSAERLIAERTKTKEVHQRQTFKL